MLLFKKKFLEAIRSGEKTQTIRLWDHCRMKAGQRSYVPGVGYVAILAVDQVELDNLSDADAVPDGFANAELLRQELFSLYAKEIAKGYKAFRICFAVYPPEEQNRMKEEKKRQKEVEIQKTVSDIPGTADVAMEMEAGMEAVLRRNDGAPPKNVTYF